MPRPQTAGAGTAWAATDTTWQSIGARSVPLERNPVKVRKSAELETDFCRYRQSMIESCACSTQSGTLLGLMHRANGIGKIAPAFIVPFAVPPRR